MLRQDGPLTDAVFAHQAQALQAVQQPGVRLAVWERPELSALSAQLAAQTAWPSLALDGELPALEQALLASSDPSLSPALHQDMLRLARAFAAVWPGQRLLLRLQEIHDDGCCRWHQDHMPLRLICTYAGKGTQWLPEPWGRRALQAPDLEYAAAQTLPTGAAALLRGCGFPGAAHQEEGVVHRSPRLAGSGGRRLVLRIDTPPS
jgi:hypothetical protein